jgi:hypothetical protein
MPLQQYNMICAPPSQREKHERPTTTKDAAELLKKRLDRQERLSTCAGHISISLPSVDADQHNRCSNREPDAAKVMDRRNRQGMRKGTVSIRYAQGHGGNRQQGTASARSHETEYQYGSHPGGCFLT